MSRSVVTVDESFSVERAWRLLDHRGVGQAPVVNAHAILVGLLTRAALANLDQFPKPGGKPEAWQQWMARPVEAVMLTPVPSVAGGADLRRVASVLIDSGLSGLPVVDDDGRVTGFVARSDILRAVLDDVTLDQWG